MKLSVSKLLSEYFNSSLITLSTLQLLSCTLVKEVKTMIQPILNKVKHWPLSVFAFMGYTLLSDSFIILLELYT